MSAAASAAPVDPRDAAVAQFRRKFLEHKELETKLKKSQATNDRESSSVNQQAQRGQTRLADSKGLGADAESRFLCRLRCVLQCVLTSSS